ncbi:MAG: hypothetical protein ACK559_06390, partial [bacterium]
MVDTGTLVAALSQSCLSNKRQKVQKYNKRWRALKKGGIQLEKMTKEGLPHLYPRRTISAQTALVSNCARKGWQLDWLRSAFLSVHK